MKEQVMARYGPKRISHIQFGIMSPQEIAQVAEIEVFKRELYQVPDRQPMPFGCLDRRLGTTEKMASCETCGKKLADCTGHFGHVKLELPVFHVGFFKMTIQLLQNICKQCSRVLIPSEERENYLKRLRHPMLEQLQKKAILKKLNEACRRISICPYCAAVNGPVKKMGMLKIIHEKYKKTSTMATEFYRTFDQALHYNPELKIHLNKAQENLNPIRVLDLFEKITEEDCELMGLDLYFGRPEHFILTQIAVPPVCIRPSVAMESGAGSNEDDLTIKLTEIIHINSIIRDALEKGSSIQIIMEDWDFLQLQCAMYINSELPGVPLSVQLGKPIRGLCQRLKGKQGRFRGNLSGKRVDFSARTVISPDPNLAIDEVGVPELIAKTLTYPEVVFPNNLSRLRKNIINGPDIHPGANYVQFPNGMKRFLKYGNREKIAMELKVGDIVERHIKDGDIVLFNRQPSLHKLSIMSHRVRVKPWRTFRLNECVCTPYNADFDGDEMNLHVPQTEEARTEAMILMGVKENLVTPRNGELLIAAIQDFITASYLISRKDQFFDRSQFAQICSYFSDANLQIDLPPPAIVKPARLWTGKQIFSILMRPNKASKILINLEAKCRGYTSSTDTYYHDTYLIIQNSEVMCGVFDKMTVGGSKNSIFYILLRNYGSNEAAMCMNRLAKLCARFLGNYGFSIGVDDVQPSSKLTSRKEDLIKKGYARCYDYISQLRDNRLQTQPGCSPEETLEAAINSVLSQIREDAGQLCLQELNPYNSPLIMALSGSKGSNINISQMVACVGQQTVNGSRVPNGFIDRSLPHFSLGSKTPEAKGFVKNSFYSGLSPTEFFFHTMAGREGLVDTAVKTAETGYMQRRLMKALEDLSIHYDLSVRNSVGGIVQFKYGDDALDPTYMEGNSRLIDFQRTLNHVLAISDLDGKPLSPNDFLLIAENRMNQKDFKNCTDLFISEIKQFILGLSDKLKDISDRIGISYPSLHYNIESSDLSINSEGWKMSTLRNIFKITQFQLEEFLSVCVCKYFKAIVEPGTAIGALGAQSIGEPGTQMTLKTFHFAGVASMNVTLGVPRIKEIINASKIISTPIITASLNCQDDVKSARIVKGRIEKTLLGEITGFLEEVYESDQCYMLVKIDFDSIKALQLEIDLKHIQSAILASSKLKLREKNVVVENDDKIRVYPQNSEKIPMFHAIQMLKQGLPKVVVKGIPTVNRAIINDMGGGKYNLLVEGYDLRNVMTTLGVDGRRTTSNHVMEVFAVLGIEAARTTIINEIKYTMSSHGMSIDSRHVMLLADVMSYKGEVLGITRFGIAKMKDSVLMLASFEKTTDHLFDAAMFSKADAIEGVSECIIMGIPMPIGTGLFKLLQQIPRETPPRRDLLFDTKDRHLDLFAINNK